MQCRSRRIFFNAWQVALILLFVVACGGGGPKLASEGIYIDVPGLMRGGQETIWRVNMVNIDPPFEVRWSFGGGASPSMVTRQSQTTFSTTTVAMLNPDRDDQMGYDVVVTVTDGLGRQFSDSTRYFVGPTPNSVPEIVSAEYNEASGELYVCMEDSEGDPLAVAIESIPDGFSAAADFAPANQQTGCAVLVITNESFTSTQASFAIQAYDGRDFSDSFVFTTQIGGN